MSLQAPIRRPPEIAHRVALTLPGLPEAMQGRTVLHLSDLHVRRYRPMYRRLIRAVSYERPDFVWLTGDYMTVPGDEEPALRVLEDLLRAVRPKYGITANFGNHDSEAFKRLARQRLGHLAEFHDHGCRLYPEFRISLLSASTPGDLPEALRRAEAAEERAGGGEWYRILLAHEPTMILPAATFGIEWMLGGHTHGGQIRLGFRFSLHNSSKLPNTLSSGILRLRDSVCTISRGIGESVVDVRLFCPRHLPLYVLGRGPLPGRHSRTLTCVEWW